jgi:hypothetical protein
VARIFYQQVNPPPWQPSPTHTQHFPTKSFPQNTLSWSRNIPLAHLISLCTILPLTYHEESSQGIIFWKHKRESEGYDMYSKHLAGEWLVEALQ